MFFCVVLILVYNYEENAFFLRLRKNYKYDDFVGMFNSIFIDNLFVNFNTDNKEVLFIMCLEKTFVFFIALVS